MNGLTRSPEEVEKERQKLREGLTEKLGERKITAEGPIKLKDGTVIDTKQIEAQLKEKEAQARRNRS